jgi:predicted naringenin-chalcone synthase
LHSGQVNVEDADNAVWQMNLLSRDKHVMPWRIEDDGLRCGFSADVAREAQGWFPHGSSAPQKRP